MKTIKVSFWAFVLISAGIIFTSGKEPLPKFPYEASGLTERQAAAHLLNRFSYGATPGQIDNVIKMGLENWFDQQLNGKIADPELDQRLKEYDVINLSNSEVVTLFPRNSEILLFAIRDGKIPKDSAGSANKTKYRDVINAYMKEKGFKLRRELFRQFINQKILRATYSNNQLHEVLTEFWFNHFNVSITKPQSADFIPAYERDVIRPNVLGKFSTLLLATAKSPAMLYYLDNFSSTGKPEEVPGKKTIAVKAPKNAGLNENYAREVMELHTLGVDGGYTQQDVTQAARVLTGWTVYPMGTYGNSAIRKVIEKVGPQAMEKNGFVRDGDFIFVPNRHDDGEKTILKHQFPAGKGYDEGVALLNMLAHHASTAKFISKKLAVRFITDQPSEALIAKLAKVFTDKDGDLKQMITAIAYSPEFWNIKNLREKTKSPFELVISTVRSLNADVLQPYQLYNWMTKMGQQIYYYQAPTGFPDYGQYWINTGSLLNRMNFGLSIAAQKIPGIRVDLAELNNNHEPESAVAALSAYSKLIMPERDLTTTIKRLTPMLTDKELAQKVTAAAAKRPATVNNTNMEDTITDDDKQPSKPPAKQTTSQMLAQVVGIIIGSPEFQRK